MRLTGNQKEKDHWASRRWIDEPNENFRILRVGNPEKLANDKEE